MCRDKKKKKLVFGSQLSLIPFKFLFEIKSYDNDRHIASREPGTNKILTLFLFFDLLWEVTNFAMAYHDPLRIQSIRCNPKCGFYSWFCGWNSYVYAIFCI